MVIHRHGVAVIDIAKIQAGIEDLDCNVRTSDTVRFSLLTGVDCNQNLEDISFRIPVSDAVDMCEPMYTTFNRGGTHVADTDGNHSSGYPATPFLTIFL